MERDQLSADIGKQKKELSVREIIKQIIEVVLGLAVCAFVINGMPYLQVKVFSEPDFVVTSPLMNVPFIISTFLITMIATIFIIRLLINKKSIYTKSQFVKKLLPILILYIGLTYLTFNNYIAFGHERIIYDPFWSTQKKVYTWDDIDSVVLSKDRRGVIDYDIYFSDGTQIDFFNEGRINIYELNILDDLIKEKGIYKYIAETPSDKRIKRTYGKKEKFDIVKKLYTE